MKILQILDKAPGDGGLAVHVADLCEQLKQHGHVAPVLRLVDGKASGTPVTTTWQDEYRLPQSYGLIQGYQLQSQCRELLDEIQPDIVHVHGCFTTLSPALLSTLQQTTRLIGTLHDVRPFCYVMSRRFTPSGALCQRRCGIGCFTSRCIKTQSPIDVLRLTRRWFMDARTLARWQTFDRVIAPSEYINHLALQHGITADSLRLVPHGIECPPAQAIPPRSNNETPVIIYLGSLFEYKGVLHLIKALSLLQQPSWRAILVGNGPLREQVMRQLKMTGLSDRVDILDHVQHRETINQLLANARMLVLPSTIPEAFALVGPEALVNKTPVVSFALGGITQWFRDGVNGLAAADLDCSDLARQIDTLLASPQLADELGSNGRALVEESFTRAQAFARTLEVYQELADTPQ